MQRKVEAFNNLFNSIDGIITLILTSTRSLGVKRKNTLYSKPIRNMEINGLR